MPAEAAGPEAAPWLLAAAAGVRGVEARRLRSALASVPSRPWMMYCLQHNAELRAQCASTLIACWWIRGVASLFRVVAVAIRLVMLSPSGLSVSGTMHQDSSLPVITHTSTSAGRLSAQNLGPFVDARATTVSRLQLLLTMMLSLSSWPTMPPMALMASAASGCLCIRRAIGANCGPSWRC